ncbi:DUF1878 family protein [Oceanobacillus bengalensis]|uniref:DUF1878 family protein n=1 Tax=Oceanobacillus bengalensis TaxID=1435466 RepID=A0A494Z862_9BACI|nr:DUF1878 family protein [Oceanobacillus bengalensis]RKQ18800.1 DUF1878 family protein [Oceanobacillus bengalensis]
MREISNCNTSSFHIHLLSNIIDMNQYPFIKLLIEKNINKKEYDELFNLLEKLDKNYLVQKEEGLINFTSLLVHFAGMLNEKLDPTETILALKKEGYYPSLINEFLAILNDKEPNKRRR